LKEANEIKRVSGGLEAPGPAKRPYHRPTVRHERVFETSALSCGKMQSTQSTCNHNRKNS